MVVVVVMLCSGEVWVSRYAEGSSARAWRNWLVKVCSSSRLRHTAGSEGLRWHWSCC